MANFTYKSYSFVDKDPMIDIVRTIIHESKVSLKQISLDSGVNPNTISAWLYGDTKRPQAASMNAVLRALGYKLEVTSINYQSTIKPTFLKEAKVYNIVGRK